MSIMTVAILKRCFGARIGGWLAAIRDIRRAYRRHHGHQPRLFGPVRYTEKIQWRKLFDLDPAYAILSDKLAVRAVIEARAGPEFLIPLLWSGDDPAAIPFERLERPYVLKSTHACGHVAIVEPDDRNTPDELRARARTWLGHCHGTHAHEPAYVHVPRRLMIERCLARPGGGAPGEIRLFVFGGRVAVANTVFVEDGRMRNGAFHTPDWRRLDWHFTRRLEDREFPPPPRLDDMIRAAERIGAGFDHLRVDFYDCGDSIHIGEVTVYPWSGLSRFNPDAADAILGAYWTIRRPRRRAAMAILLGRREIPAATVTG
jgi:hypothetical protein